MREPFPEHLERAVFATGCFWGTEKVARERANAGQMENDERPTTNARRCSGEFRACTPRRLDTWADTLRIQRTRRCAVDAPDTRRACRCSSIRASCRTPTARHALTCHDPTQGNRQGNDRGTQYRSGIYCTSEEQLKTAQESAETTKRRCKRPSRRAPITTEIKGPGDTFFYAEDYHQQYLAKPRSRPYCSAQPTGVPVPADWLGRTAPSSVRDTGRPSVRRRAAPSTSRTRR